MTTAAAQQKAMYYEAVKKSGERDTLFLQLVGEGMTRKELETCIKRRPALWERYVAWLDKLP